MTVRRSRSALASDVVLQNSEHQNSRHRAPGVHLDCPQFLGVASAPVDPSRSAMVQPPIPDRHGLLADAPPRLEQAQVAGCA